MKLPTIRLIFDRKKQATKTTKGLVQIEVQYQRKRKYISTGIKLLDYQWSDSEHVIKHPQAFTYNTQLNDFVNYVTDKVRELVRSTDGFSLEKLSNLSLTSDKPLVLDFMQEELEKSRLSEGTIKHYWTVIEELNDYGRMSTFDEVTPDEVERWDARLHRRGIATTSVYNYHKVFKKFLNIAVKKGLLSRSPYDTYKPDRGVSKQRVYLDEAELQRMREAVISVKYVAHIRDLYLFQCFTGLAYKDLETLDFRTCIEQRNERSVVVANRAKTNEAYYIVLMRPALEILERYDYDLRVPALQVYNRYLASVAAACNITKHLTTHTARHTFAVWALNHGTPIEVVSKILGHTNIVTTQIYAKIVNKTIEDNFERLEAFL